MKNLTILAIETSCDETAAAVVIAKSKVKSQKAKVRNSPTANDFYIEILSNVVASQINLHKKYGGVYPELASRAHTEKIFPTIRESLEIFNSQFSISKAMEETPSPNKLVRDEIDAIAVIYGPGLIGSLTVGVTAAKTLAYIYKKPIIPINHLEGHLYSAFIKAPTPQFPALFLTVSGGHTNLILMKNHGEYKILGQTKDDAAGEAFDKVAKLLGLGYPGGPAISAMAEMKSKIQNSKFKIKEEINFPRPMLNEKNFDFSFSGLKTAVLYKLRELGKVKEETRAEMAAEFQRAVVETLVGKARKAAEKYLPKSICLTGGVAANRLLREEFVKMAEKLDFKPTIHIPPLKYTTDNAAMVGTAGIYRLLSGKTKKWYSVNVAPNATLTK